MFSIFGGHLDLLDSGFRRNDSGGRNDRKAIAPVIFAGENQFCQLPRLRGGGATLKTSSGVVRPATTALAPLRRKGRIPSLIDWRRRASRLMDELIRSASSGVTSMISKIAVRPR